MSDLILSAKDFKTLSSETRVQIIKLLASRNFNLTELSGKLKLAMPSIKQHIDVLLEGGLIEQVDDNHKWKYYCLSRKGRKLVEPYSSNVLIVLSSSLIGILGLALVASAIFGFGSAMLGSASNIAGDSSKTLASPATQGVLGISETAASQAAIPAVSQAFNYYPIASVLVGALLLVFAFLVFKRKIALFR